VDESHSRKPHGSLPRTRFPRFIFDALTSATETMGDSMFDIVRAWHSLQHTDGKPLLRTAFLPSGIVAEQRQIDDREPVMCQRNLPLGGRPGPGTVLATN
jgi:hypothetical protein